MDRKMKSGIKDFLREVNPAVKVRFQDYELEVNIYEETVYVGQSIDKRADKYFMEYIESLNPEAKDLNPTLISLLHELGHIETWTEEELDDKDFIFGVLQYAYQDVDLFEHEEILKDYCFKYFNIPLERNATLWAIDFALSHKELLAKYDWLEI